MNSSPPDYNSVRGLPPLPPLPPPPGSPPSLAIAASSSKGLDRVLLERNLEKLLTERGGSNHSSSSEHLPLEGDLGRILGLTDGSGLCLESHIEKLSFKDDSGKTTNLNLSKLAISGNTSTDVKPEMKKLFLEIDTCDSGKIVSRKDFKLVLDHDSDKEDRQGKKLNLDEIETVLEYEKRNVDPLRLHEPSTSLDWRPQLNDSSHDSGHASSMPELTVQPPTPNSPQRKNVRFKGAPLELEERRLPRSRSYSGRPDPKHDLDDTESYCSTCSSSSSSDDMSAYQLPPRRAYGGVRISYVPNDAFAIARQRQHTPQHVKSPTKKTVDDKNCVIS